MNDTIIHWFVDVQIRRAFIGGVRDGVINGTRTTWDNDLDPLYWLNGVKVATSGPNGLWKTANPDNQLGIEGCMEIFVGLFNDLECRFAIPFICENVLNWCVRVFERCRGEWVIRNSVVIATKHEILSSPVEHVYYWSHIKCLVMRAVDSNGHKLFRKDNFFVNEIGPQNLNKIRCFDSCFRNDIVFKKYRTSDLLYLRPTLS